MSEIEKYMLGIVLIGITIMDYKGAYLVNVKVFLSWIGAFMLKFNQVVTSFTIL